MSAFVRFICGLIMHISCNYEILNGMVMMKFAVNHYWKFYNYRLAYMSGLLQLVAMILITICSYLVISIETRTLEITKNFFALMIVSDFDDIFGALQRELPKEICTEE